MVQWIVDSIYHSYRENNDKWWMVVLSAASIITKIRIFNRADCCSWCFTLSHHNYTLGLGDRTSMLTIHASFHAENGFQNDSSSFHNVSYYHGPPPERVAVTSIDMARLVIKNQLSFLHSNNIQVARTIAISKPYTEDAINFGEVEIIGHLFEDSNPKYCNYIL